VAHRWGSRFSFITIRPFLAKPGIYLEDLFVHPEARGRGIGKRLLVWLAQTTVERDCGRLEWSVLDWNEPSIGFYKSLGAVLKSEWQIFRLTGEALTGLARQQAT
jgi:GNAT superfamily N-acetyltransferase